MDIKKVVNKIEDVVDDAAKTLREKIGYAHPVRLDTYAGLGHGSWLSLRGRVLADRPIKMEPEQSKLENVMDMLRRYGSDEVPGAKLVIHVEGERVEVESDEEGYYEAQILVDAPMRDGHLWHEAQVELISPLSEAHPEQRTRFEAAFQVPQPGVTYGVISDIDDTIIRTSADNLLKHIATVMLNNAHSRDPFPGMGALLRALTYEEGEPTQPLFFLSSSPWNLHSLFTEMFHIHGIPRGTFFLKDFGVDRDKFIKSGHSDHKLSHLKQLLEHYPELKFVLMGDSGQHDADIYAELARANPERLLAIYIRNVSKTPREGKVQALAEAVTQETGVPMVLVKGTDEIAEHAAGLGLLDAAEVELVRQDRRHDQQEDG